MTTEKTILQKVIDSLAQDELNSEIIYVDTNHEIGNLLVNDISLFQKNVNNSFSLNNFEFIEGKIDLIRRDKFKNQIIIKPKIILEYLNED